MTRTTVLLSILLLAAGGAFLWWRETRAPRVRAVLYEVRAGDVEAIVANTRAGTVEARRRSKLAPQTGGQVHRLLVREGDRVESGQVLLELWNDDLQAQIALAESEEARARALVEQAQVMAENAERESRRSEELQREGVSSPEATERLMAEAKARKAEVEANQATVRVAGDRVRSAKATLERTILRAPFAGVVAEINAELGEYVTPSPPGIPTLPAIDLIDTEGLYVKAPIDEVDSATIAAGMAARIELDALPGRSFAGLVGRVAPYVLDREKEARTVDVEVRFRDAEDSRPVLPGASADVEIVLATARDRLRVPTAAILEGRKVLVFTGAGLPLAERAIETGVGNWEFTEVKTGLRAGDRIVVSVDREGVRAGALVIPEDGTEWQR